MGVNRRSQRHLREVHGIDSAGETPEDHGENYQPGFVRSFYHDFSLSSMGPFPIRRNSDAYGLDYRLNPVVVGLDTPVLNGYRWTGATWQPAGQGQGLYLETVGVDGTARTYIQAPLTNLGSLLPNITNNFCGELQWFMKEDLEGLPKDRNRNTQFFSIEGYDPATGNYPGLYIQAAGIEQTSPFPVDTDSLAVFVAFSNVVSGIIQFDIPTIGGIKARDAMCMRFRKDDTNTPIGSGLTAWLYKNGELLAKTTTNDPYGRWPIVDCSAGFSVPADLVDMNADWYSENRAKTVTIVRIVDAALPDKEIEAWPFWEFPAQEFYWDFSRQGMGQFSFLRDSEAKGPDYLGNIVTVGHNIPFLAGWRWDGVTWHNENVGTGLFIQRTTDGVINNTISRTPLQDLAPLPAVMYNDFCGEVQGYIPEGMLADNFLNMMAIVGDVANPRPGQLTLSATVQFYPHKDTDVPQLAFFIEPFEYIDGIVDLAFDEILPNQHVTVRFRKRSVAGGSVDPNGYDGITAWLYLDGVLIDKKNCTRGRTTGAGNPDTGPVDCTQDFDRPVDRVEIATNWGNTSQTYTLTTVRIDPYPRTDAEIEAWPFWVQPPN